MEAAAASPICMQPKIPESVHCMHTGSGGAANLPCTLVVAQLSTLQLKGEWLRVPLDASAPGAACSEHPEGCSSDGYLFLGSPYAQNFEELMVRRIQGHMINGEAGLPGCSAHDGAAWRIRQYRARRCYIQLIICHNSHALSPQASGVRISDLPPSSLVLDLCKLSEKYKV